MDPIIKKICEEEFSITICHKKDSLVIKGALLTDESYVSAEHSYPEDKLDTINLEACIDDMQVFLKKRAISTSKKGVAV